MFFCDAWLLSVDCLNCFGHFWCQCGFWVAGEKKLSKVIVPDKWKEGASNTTEGGGRKINENKLLSKKNRSF